MTEVELEKGSTLKGGFEFTEWQDDVYVMLTQLKRDTALNETNSKISSAETWYYNRNTKEGDWAGRLPVTEDKKWHLLMLNYDEKNE